MKYTHRETHTYKITPTYGVDLVTVKSAVILN